MRQIGAAAAHAGCFRHAAATLLRLLPAIIAYVAATIFAAIDAMKHSIDACGAQRYAALRRTRR